MARRVRGVSGGEEFSRLLEGLTGDQAVTVMKAACYAGAGVLADALKSEIQNLPEQEGYMPEGKQRNVITKHDKRMLQERIGISRIDSTSEKADVVISFSGYNDKPTKKYRTGTPIPLIARSIESGSSVRKKNPFVRRAFNSAQSTALQKAIDAGQKELNDIINGG
jgi:hypothetical protein